MGAGSGAAAKVGWGCSSEAPETRAGWLAGLLAPETTHPPTQLFPRQLAAKLGVSARWNLDFSPFSSFSLTDRPTRPSFHTVLCVAIVLGQRMA